MTNDSNPQAAPSPSPLSVPLVQEALRESGRLGSVIHLDVCDSTNAYAAALEPRVLDPQGWALVVAEEQTAGRGRLDRSWVSQASTGLLFSVAIQAARPPSGLSLFPLLCGAAVAGCCREFGVPAQVKWPNDVVVTDADRVRKLGGVLLERTTAAVVVGVGLNVSAFPDPSQAPEGAALSDHGLTISEGVRERLLAACTAAILAAWETLVTGEHANVLAEYRAQCATLGQRVRALLPDGSTIEGRAENIDTSGRLLVADVAAETEPVALSVGDIVHLRSH